MSSIKHRAVRGGAPLIINKLYQRDTISAALDILLCNIAGKFAAFRVRSEINTDMHSSAASIITTALVCHQRPLAVLAMAGETRNDSRAKY